MTTAYIYITVTCIVKYICVDRQIEFFYSPKISKFTTRHEKKPQKYADASRVNHDNYLKASSIDSLKSLKQFVVIFNFGYFYPFRKFLFSSGEEDRKVTFC